MDYTKNSGYSVVPPDSNQFVVQNIADLDYPISTNGANGNVVQARNSQPNKEARIPVQAEATNSIETEDISNISISDVSSGVTEVPHRNHVFEFHDPFDFNSYPITNPPIFDSTMMLPYTTNEGIQRRRRISISNGQIGQIVNHEFYLDNESPLDDELNGTRQVSLAVSKDDTMLNGINSRQTRVSVRAGQAEQFVSHQQTQIQEKELAPQSRLKVELNIPPGQGQRTLNKNQLKSEASRPAAGVPPPNHQLIYNNEVIYNPNNGPIPGTAAWKKERLLERNRLAASKCRQRKKHAQQQLQDNVSKYQKDVDLLKGKIKKYETVLKNISLIISKHEDKLPNSDLKILTKFNDIDAITDIDLDAISKIAKN